MLTEFTGDTTVSGRDVMNGGSDGDFIEGNTGPDILRGQEGDDSAGGQGNPQSTSMFGDEGNDDLFGGPGEDGGRRRGYRRALRRRNADFIDAAANEAPGATDAPDLVDCGSGFDTALVLPNDTVRSNCEDVTDVSTIARVGDPGTTDDEGQQRQKELFLQSSGGTPQPAAAP